MYVHSSRRKDECFVILEAYHGGYTVLYNNTFQPIKNEFQGQRVQAEAYGTTSTKLSISSGTKSRSATEEIPVISMLSTVHSCYTGPSPGLYTESTTSYFFST